MSVATLLLASLILGSLALIATDTTEKTPTPQASLSGRRVLFLSSYHAGFDTLPGQITGLLRVFFEHRIQMDIEFMDERRLSGPQHDEIIYNYLAYKLSELDRYDALVVGDDAALQFAMDYREDLFDGIPVVFMCINDDMRGQAAAAMGFTGVMESVSADETIEVAAKLMPQATRVLSIHDGTPTGQGDEQSFFAIKDQFLDLSFEGLNVSEYTFDEAFDIIGDIEDDTIVIYQTMFLDKEGTYLPIEEAIRRLVEVAQVPIFRLSVSGIGDGLVGGKIILYERQGEVAAEYVVRILNGEPAASIPVLTESTNEYVFDYEVMQAFGLDAKRLPEDAIMLNMPTRFAEEYVEEIAIALFVTLLALIVVGIIYRDNKALRKTKEDLLNSRERLKLLAYTDALTGLPNRNHFNHTMYKMDHDPEYIKSQDSVMLYADLDDFKLVNDALGHKKGDQLLKAIADRLAFLKEDYPDLYLARIGGDEFALFLRGVEGKAEAKKIAENMRDAFIEPFHILDLVLFTTVSIGVARYPLDAPRLTDLAQCADMAMYHAKRGGKNRYSFFDKSMTEGTQKAMQIQNAIPNALRCNNFFLVYQPQFDIDGKKIAGYEALIRWDDPKLGFMSPGEFIPIAEKTGQIISIGRWVLKEACTFAHKINDAQKTAKVVSVNISAIELMQHDFFDALVSVVALAKVPPSWIGLEITETALITALQHNATVLSRIQEMGFKIMLDDFGTGYSSLQYLRDLPIDILKIDKTFIETIGTSTRDDGMLALILEIAHLYDMQVVAEGVETTFQYQHLIDIGCDGIQGFLLARPMREEAVLAIEAKTRKARKPKTKGDTPKARSD